MPRGLRKLHFSFEEVALTGFGGLSLFQSFCKSFGLRHLFRYGVVGPIAKAQVADFNQFAILLITFASEKHES